MLRMSLVATLALSLAGFAACNKSNDEIHPAEKPAADNTGINERDRADKAVTPTDQQENDRDLGITQAVRQAVVGDDALSFNAKNVKIVTSGGVVTLRGPVKSDAERQSIETKAVQVAGVKRVDNQLQIEAE